MLPPRSALALLGYVVAIAYAQDDDEDPEYEDMGPAAFMWPADRVWSAAADNTAPCGSVASPGNRTDFPMQNGQIALVAQDDSYEIELSIAYMNDPQSNDDFDTLIDAEHFRELDPGHTCVPVEDSPDSANPGDNATLQIKYIANFDKPDNETFYACADVKLVETSLFKEKVPCFNATEPDDEDGAGPDWDYHDDVDEDKDDDDDDDDDKKSSESGSSDSDSSNDDSEDKKSSGGMSGGAIAGAVVGSLAGVGLIAAAALFFYRRRQQRISKARQESTSRGVQWESQQAGKASVSSSSVRMQNLSP